MAAAVIDLSAVIDTFGGTTPTSLQFSAQVMRGGQPALRVAGNLATVSAPLTWYWTGTAWAPQAPQLTDVDLDCYWLVELANPDRSIVLRQTVILPAGHGGTVAFGSLAAVDPVTLIPTPTTLQTWLQQAEPLGLSPTTAASLAATYVKFQYDDGTALSGRHVVITVAKADNSIADIQVVTP